MMIVIVNRFSVANNVRQLMIERTAILLAKKGLHGTSFSDILEATGAPRGSLYHHFPGGKNELVLAALDAAGGRAMELLQSLSGRPAPDVAEAFIGLWRLVLDRSQFQAGCAVVAVTVAADSPELRDAAAAVFHNWRTRLGELFVAGGISEARAFSLSASLIAACEGAVILSRAEHSFEPFDLVAVEQLAIVRASVSPSS